MGYMPSRNKDFDVDLESGGTDPVLGAKVAKPFVNVCNGFVSVDESIKGENRASLSGNVPNISGVETVENVELLIGKIVEGGEAADIVEKNKSGKERRKTTSAKKPPRPPRPPKALSLDAADQKLIKEISELAMMKRARIERMKALKKMKVAKTSTSTGNLFAMIFTALFCLVIIFQGMSPGRGPPLSFQGSPESTEAADSGFIYVRYHRNKSPSDASMSSSGYPSLVEQVSGSDSSDKVSRATG